MLKEIAYEKIKAKILSGDDLYTSGVSLVEELQMSRTPIREALQRLEQEGFIRLLPNQGIAIPELSVKEVNDIFDFRIAIETASLKQVAPVLRTEHFLELDRMLEEQKAALQRNDLFHFIDSDVRFHLYLLGVGGNRLFMNGVELVSERLHRLSRRIKNKPQKLQELAREHERIVGYLKERRLELALQTLESHLKGGKIDIYGGI